MNKQELVKRIKQKVGLCTSREIILRLVEQLDEPQKPVVPQYVAGWIDSCKSKNSLRNALITAPVNGKIYDWLNQHEDGKFLNQETFALAWILGYTVEKEKRYKVRMRGVANLSAYLNLDITDNKLYMCDSDNLSGSRTHFTRKELEEAGFGDVFNSSLFEVEEVEE